MQKLHYVGLDVHARTITVAVATGCRAKALGTIEHDVSKLRKVLRKLGSAASLRIFYEAGPTGYGLCRMLRDTGYSCEVIAPSLIPTMPGDRVKTDRRDAKKLAMLAQGGLLTHVYVPEVGQEAVRDLVRAREAAKACEKKAGQRLDKFLLRHDRRPAKMKKWSLPHMKWVRSQQFDEPMQQTVLEEHIAEYEHQRERVRRFDDHLAAAVDCLQPQQRAVVRALVALKGVRILTAVTVVSEVGDMMRFGHPTQLMSYAGQIPREHSSGDAVRRGAITKAGNAHLRRVVGESAWSYSRGCSSAGRDVRKRREGLSPAIVAIAERADQRLRKRYRALAARGKHKNKVATAVGRELLGFMWAIAVQAQMEYARSEEKAKAA